MSTTAIVVIAVAGAILLGVVAAFAIRAQGTRRRAIHREQAGTLRETAQEHELDAARQRAAAEQQAARARRAQAEADEKAALAQAQSLDAQERLAAAGRASDLAEAHHAQADEIDPDVQAHERGAARPPAGERAGIAAARASGDADAERDDAALTAVDGGEPAPLVHSEDRRAAAEPARSGSRD